jgi:protein SCO1/2
MPRILAPALLLAAALAGTAAAHHPGEELDAVIAAREPAFEVVDAPAPPFDLVDGQGQPLRLSDLGDQIVVLDFAFAACAEGCPLQSGLVARVQDMVNASAMRDMVRFVTVTTDPAADTPEARAAYGRAHGLDPVNWTFATVLPGEDGDATRRLAQAYGAEPDADGRPAPAIHVIDREGRLAGRFQGLDAEPLNLVLYINGLTQPPQGAAEGEAGWWDRVTGLLD